MRRLTLLKHPKKHPVITKLKKSLIIILKQGIVRSRHLKKAANRKDPVLKPKRNT